MILLILLLSQAAEVESHIKKACEVVWDTEYQVNNYVTRGMEAMSNEARLRNNELKLLLMSCDKELEKAKEQLQECRGQ